MTSRTQRRRRPQPSRGTKSAGESPRDRRDEALLAQAGPDGIPAGVSRRRDRLGYAVVVSVTVAGVVLPALLERLGAIRSGAPVAGGLAGLVLAVWIPALHSAGRTVCHGPGGGLLTARTVLGPRTVNAASLTRIGRVRRGGRFGWQDELTVTDSLGVRLRISDGKTLRHLAALLAADPGTGAGTASAVRISEPARALLGLTVPTRDEVIGRALVDLLASVIVPLAQVLAGVLLTWALASG